MQQQTVAEINLAVLRANYRRLASMASPAAMIVPVKADAYGHGAATVARCLAGEGARCFAVVTLDEALELREAGISRDILVMGVVDPRRVPQAVAADVAVTFHSGDHARQCEAAARSAKAQLRVHLKVDTGMHRLGVACEEAADLAVSLSGSDAVTVEGLMTHMSHAEEPDLAVAKEQLDRFRRLVAQLDRRGIRPPLVHAANSATVMRCPDGLFTGVRPGFALYAGSPCPELTRGVALRGVMTLRTVVALLKDLRPGEGTSYGHTWRARVPSRIAALPIGYADGYCRALGNRAAVRIAGLVAPVVGNVCMDTTMIDVTEVPGVTVGTPVALIEADPASQLSVHALARLAGTIPHEILTGIGRRVRRAAVDGDK